MSSGKTYLCVRAKKETMTTKNLSSDKTCSCVNANKEKSMTKKNLSNDNKLTRVYGRKSKTKGKILLSDKTCCMVEPVTDEQVFLDKFSLFSFCLLVCNLEEMSRFSLSSLLVQNWHASF